MADALGFVREEIEALKQEARFHLPRVLDGPQEPVAEFDGRQVVNLSSNNYLGLANDPRLKEAAIAATRQLGVGSASVRTIAGTMRLHDELERRLAVFKCTEASLVYQSGFAANAGTVACLLGREDVIVSDELNHASIIDGSRLSRAQIKVFAHRNLEALRQRLEETRAEKARRALVVTDGVFSMDGDIAPLPDIVRIAREFGAITMVDDAHASGVLGTNGRGSVDHYGLHGQVDIQVGTLSKAIGVLGGYVAGSQVLKEFLLNRARPILFSTSHPPAVTAANLAALEILENEPERIERLWQNTQFFKQGLAGLGLDTGASETPITPVITGETALAFRLSARLFEEGVFAQAIGFPTVARDRARVRTIVTATHREEDLARALEAFARVARELGIAR